MSERLRQHLYNLIRLQLIEVINQFYFKKKKRLINKQYFIALLKVRNQGLKSLEF